MSHKEQAMEARLRRFKGMNDDDAARLNAHNMKCENWRGACRVCGFARQGTLEALSGPCPMCGLGPGGQNGQ